MILADNADKFIKFNYINLNDNQITDAGLRALEKHAEKFKNLS
jgi:hypothetical protein